MKKSILLLGGSRQQVIAIKKAKELGYRTVLCDYLPDNPGQYDADVYYQESTTDRERMLEIARKENVSGVLAYSSDPASPTAGYVAEKLGLPSNPLSAIEIMSEKHLFRQFLLESGFPCPRAVSFGVEGSPSDILDRLSGLTYPIVIKPTDSSGSKGVHFLDSPAGIMSSVSASSRFSRNGVLIAEEFIQRSLPFVIGGDIFVLDGEVRFWGLMACMRDESLGGLVPVGKYLPAGLPDSVARSVKRLLRGLVSKLGLRFGELNVEIIVGENGVPYILELGSRAGGNMIPVELSDASGIDLVSANVQAAMGEDHFPIDWDSEVSAGQFATYVIHSAENGVLERIEIDSAIARHIYRRVDYIQPGDQVSRFDGANKALGIVFLKFESDQEMMRALPRLPQLIAPVLK